MTIFRLSPLPDFLSDHTLAGEVESSRLREHGSRWIQFVAGLWVWNERASFAIRYIGCGGTIRCFLIAVARTGIEEATLTRCLEASLLSQRLIRATDRYLCDKEEFASASALRDPCFMDRSQLVGEGLWRFPPSLKRQSGLRRTAVDPAGIPEEPVVVFPWQGPSGNFIAPMELLAVQQEKTVFTVYLTPVQMPADEMRFLSFLASAAQSESMQSDAGIGQGGVSRKVEAGAALAGEIYASHLRRLAPNAFLTLAQVATEGRRFDVARSLVASLAACVMDPNMESGSNSGGFPVGLSPCLDISDTGFSEENQNLFAKLDLLECCPQEIDARLQLLADARGASTLFRFPVSIRGGVPGIEVRQFPPDYHDGPIIDELPPGHRRLVLGKYSSGGVASLPVDHLTRHALIVGFTGSGKTVTALGLLHQLLVDHGVPWLVLESAKQEYRGFTGVEAIRAKGRLVRVYTLGNDVCVPFRLNPFQLLRGVRVEAHIARIQVCFEAAVPAVGPSSSVIFESLCKVYEKHGWSLRDTCPVDGPVGRDFPSLRSFVEVVSEVIEARGYRGEVKSNVEAALVGRFKPLLMGSKGLMFDVQACDPPPEILFEEPVVLEMNDLNLDDKAMTVMFILTLLREYREIHKAGKRGLQHITMVEEAHNILEEVGSHSGSESQADTRSKAVATFCSMLAEIRSLGEGIIIADQSPQKLARDAIRNTNLQIAHQLRDGHDRETMASAMIMDEDQVNFLAKLEVGHAAVFWTGREKAGFIKANQYYDGPNPPGVGFARDMCDQELQDYMEGFFGKRTYDRWVDWYLLIKPETRRQRGITLGGYWEMAVELACQSQGGNAVSVTAEDAWLTFTARWQNLMEVAQVTPSQRALTPAHRELFMKAFQQSA